jgi:hypothetical protein
MPDAILEKTKYAKGLSFPPEYCGYELVCHDIGTPEKCGLLEIAGKDVLWVLTNINGQLNLRFMISGIGLGHLLNFEVLPDNLEKVILDMVGSMMCSKST